MRFEDKQLDVPVAAQGAGSAWDVREYDKNVVHVRGTFVGTVAIETTLDGTNWIALTSVTGAAIYSLADSAFRMIRVNVTAYTSGQPVVWWAGRRTYGS